jgi:hypothetical protein
MNASEALAFVERHGIVLESARHPTIPSLAEAIAGGPLRGGWWSHPKGRSIFAATRAVRDSADVLVCRLVEGKITFVHSRFWPALVRLADRFPATALERVREVHSKSGAHRLENIAFPEWVPAETTIEAKNLSEAKARTAFEMLLPELVVES